MAEYTGSKQAQYEHWFGSCVNMARLWFHMPSLAEDTERLRLEFISEIEKTMRECHDYGTIVTDRQLQLFINLAERRYNDWSNPEQVKALYRAKAIMYGKPVEAIESLFP